MKIANLKQPYRRMAEYCKVNIDADDVAEAFIWDITNHDFWKAIDNGGHPPITEEIKKHFPPDFDFSGEEKVLILSLNELAIRLFGKEFNYLETYEKEQVVTSQENKLEFLTKKQNISLFDKENQRKMEDEDLQKSIYTQLAKEGKFDQLPDTCEFSMPITLEVFDKETKMLGEKWIVGRFRGRYISTGFNVYLGVRLPTPKIDFSEFKFGDVVEVELVHNETRIGWFDFTNHNHLYIRILQRKNNNSCAGIKAIDKEKIKSITKIK